MSAHAATSVEVGESADGDVVAHRSPGALGWLGQVLGWLVILGVLLITALMLVVPRLGGAEPYTILTGSMRTSYPPGTLVVIKPVDAEQVQIGDVITFQLESGQDTVVTHRVIGVRAGADGQPEFITKGDANPSADADAVRSVQLRGRLWYAVPYLGRVNVLLSGHQRQLAVYGVVGALGLYAASMFVGAARDRRRPAPETGRHRI